MFRCGLLFGYSGVAKRYGTIKVMRNRFQIINGNFIGFYDKYITRLFATY